jgi:hypothetical protein
MQRPRRISVLATLGRKPAWALAVLGLVLAVPSAAPAQPGPLQPLQLDGIQIGGVRGSVTEGWAKLEFRLSNRTGTDRQARVLALYEGRPAAQYGRDIWVPAHATIVSWLPLGPAPPAEVMGRELQLLLRDLTGGEDKLLLPPTEEHVRGGVLPYRKRETATVLVTDIEREQPPVYGQLPAPEPPDKEIIALIQAWRSVREFSDHVNIYGDSYLPRWPRAFDGIDHVVLASARMSEDPAGMRALRRWLEQGGQVWVMLDRVALEAVAPLLDEAIDFDIVGRVSLTEFRLEDGAAPRGAAAAPQQQHERPVDFVRVQLPPGEAVRYTLGGWPVAFSRTVGRGTVLFTTLGPRGWYRPETAGHPSDALRMATDVLQARSASPPPIEAFEGLLTQEIGYSIVSRRTVLIVGGTFALSILCLGMLAQRFRRSEWLGWVAPGAALATAAVFLVAGELARRAAPATVAYGQVVEAVAGTDEAAVHGMLAVYRPDSGPLDAGAWRGAYFDLDLAGVQDQTRRLVMTDMDAWHWENLALPAGVRFAPFEFTARSTAPLEATARFGPGGIEGKVTANGISNLTDGLVTAPGARNLGLWLKPTGEFSAGIADALPIGQYLARTLLSDRQQRRQEVFRRFLKRSAGESVSDAPVLMAWGDPLEMPFHLPAEARMVGTALVSMPLRFERTPPGTPVSIPGSFVSVRRVLEGKLARPVFESTLASEQRLRFQLPSAVLPLKIERARLIAKIKSPSREVTIAEDRTGQAVLHKSENPLGPIEVEIAGAGLLRLDATGGLHFDLTISDPIHAPGGRPGTGDATPAWTIEYIELEVFGTTEAPAADKDPR